MVISKVTRPAVTSENDLQEMEREMRDEPEFVGYDVRFTRFMGTAAAIFTVLITSCICWSAVTLIKVQSDIAVLLARPIGVARDEYIRDITRYDTEIQELKREEEKVREYHDRSGK